MPRFADPAPNSSQPDKSNPHLPEPNSSTPRFSEPQPPESPAPQPPAHPKLFGLLRLPLQKNSAPKTRKKRTKARLGAEILLGVLVSGLGAAIILPSFLHQGCGGHVRTAEGKQYTGAMGRMQQVHHLETGTFYSDIDVLSRDLGISAQSQNYIYFLQLKTEENAVLHYAIPRTEQSHTVISGVSAIAQANGEWVTVAGMCVGDNPGVMPDRPTFDSTGKLKCGEGSHAVP